MPNSGSTFTCRCSWLVSCCVPHVAELTAVSSRQCVWAAVCAYVCRNAANTYAEQTRLAISSVQREYGLPAPGSSRNVFSWQSRPDVRAISDIMCSYIKEWDYKQVGPLGHSASQWGLQGHEAAAILSPNVRTVSENGTTALYRQSDMGSASFFSTDTGSPISHLEGSVKMHSCRRASARHRASFCDDANLPWYWRVGPSKAVSMVRGSPVFCWPAGALEAAAAAAGVGCAPGPLSQPLGAAAGTVQAHQHTQGQQQGSRPSRAVGCANQAAAGLEVCAGGGQAAWWLKPSSSRLSWCCCSGCC